MRRKSLILSLLLALPLALAACENTIEGMGDDIEEAGDEIENATD